MWHTFSFIAQHLGYIAFPNVCVCCGRENTNQQQQICSFCLRNRFEDANPENEMASGDSLLPDGIKFQQALWNFDKNGDLQHLLHQLKYHRLTTIGRDLGQRLGERVSEHDSISRLLRHNNTILVPVPLHYIKYRYRGFNQAFEIACGFESVWSNTNICGMDDIVRTKNTRTQTGFSLQERLKNMERAFKLRSPSIFDNKMVVIIDDVFTTGATTFELAQTILQASAAGVGILTIAQA